MKNPRGKVGWGWGGESGHQRRLKRRRGGLKGWRGGKNTAWEAQRRHANGGLRMEAAASARRQKARLWLMDL